MDINSTQWDMEPKEAQCIVVYVSKGLTIVIIMRMTIMASFQKL